MQCDGMTYQVLVCVHSSVEAACGHAYMMVCVYMPCAPLRNHMRARVHEREAAPQHSAISQRAPVRSETTRCRSWSWATSGSEREARASNLRGIGPDRTPNTTTTVRLRARTCMLHTRVARDPRPAQGPCFSAVPDEQVAHGRGGVGACRLGCPHTSDDLRPLVFKTL